MVIPQHTAPGAALTGLILETFKLNGRILAAGTALTAGTGLSSARWQVMGAIEIDQRPLTVAQIARSMGLSRQSVQRVADFLEEDGMIEYFDNPDHRRAKLLRFTAKGRSALHAVGRLQVLWVNELAKGLSKSEISSALRVMRAVRARLEAAERRSSDRKKSGDSQ